jgi:hypothetical protein
MLVLSRMRFVGIIWTPPPFIWFQKRVENFLGIYAEASYRVLECTYKPTVQIAEEVESTINSREKRSNNESYEIIPCSQPSPTG